MFLVHSVILYNQSNKVQINIFKNNVLWAKPSRAYCYFACVGMSLSSRGHQPIQLILLSRQTKELNALLAESPWFSSGVLCVWLNTSVQFFCFCFFFCLMGIIGCLFWFGLNITNNLYFYNFAFLSFLF